MKCALVTIMIAGCSFPTPSEQYACTTTSECEAGRTCELGYCVTGSGSSIDAPRDTTQPDGARCTGWTPRHFDACTIPDPTGPVALTAAGVYAYDTTLGTLTGPGGVAITHASQIVAAGRVISVDAFEVGPGVTLRVTGPHPLIVASWSTIQIAGTIDVASTTLAAGGGSNPAACATHAALPGTTNAGGAGGGGGGSLGGIGGPGGSGDGGNAPGGGGGTAVAMAPLLVGGCSGGKGGDGNQPGGIAGKGGGAVQLTARMALTVAATARLNAGGSAGGAGQASNGAGGGGGSGGMLGLQGATVAVASGAILAANGGGGGEGSGNQQGVSGQDARVSAVRAVGGAGGSDAGDGGPGGAGATVGGLAGANDGTYGGGGGGGGAGFIVVTSDAAAAIDAGAVLSPPATIVAP
jgi:hypothetical protein